jgi:hypothetical protein
MQGEHFLLVLSSYQLVTFCAVTRMNRLLWMEHIRGNRRFASLTCCVTFALIKFNEKERFRSYFRLQHN